MVTLEGAFKLIDGASPVLDRIERKAKAADRALKKVGGALDLKAQTARVKVLETQFKSLVHTAQKAEVKLTAIMTAKTAAVNKQISRVKALRDQVRLLGQQRAVAHVEVAGIDEATARVATLEAALDRLDGRVAKSTTTVTRRGMMDPGSRAVDRNMGAATLAASEGFFARMWGGLERFGRRVSGVIGNMFGRVGDFLSHATGRIAGFARRLFADGSQISGVLRTIGAGALSAGSGLLSFAGNLGPLPFLAIAALPAITALAGAISALVGSLGSAVLGAGALGVGLLGAFAVGIGSIAAVAMPAISALGKYKKAVDALHKAQRTGSPQAIRKAADEVNRLEKAMPGVQGVIATLGKLKDRWMHMTGSGRRSFFEVIREGVKTANALLPTVAHTANGVMVGVRRAVRSLGRALRGGEFKGFIESMGGLFRSITPAMTSGFISLGRAFGKIAEAAKPYLIHWFNTAAGALRRFSDSLDKPARGGHGKTRAQVAVDGMVHSLKSWVRLIGSVAGLMKDFFGAGAKHGDNLVDRITKGIDKLREKVRKAKADGTLDDWFSKQVKKTQDFADDLWSVAKALGAIGRTLSGIVQTVGKITPGNNAIVDLLGAYLGYKAITKGGSKGLRLLSRRLRRGGSAGGGGMADPGTSGPLAPIGSGGGAMSAVADRALAKLYAVPLPVYVTAGRSGKTGGGGPIVPPEKRPTHGPSRTGRLGAAVGATAAIGAALRGRIHHGAARVERFIRHPRTHEIIHGTIERSPLMPLVAIHSAAGSPLARAVPRPVRRLARPAPHPAPHGRPGRIPLVPGLGVGTALDVLALGLTGAGVFGAPRAAERRHIIQESADPTAFLGFAAGLPSLVGLPSATLPGPLGHGVISTGDELALALAEHTDRHQVVGPGRAKERTRGAKTMPFPGVGPLRRRQTVEELVHTTPTPLVPMPGQMLPLTLPYVDHEGRDRHRRVGTASSAGTGAVLVPGSHRAIPLPQRLMGFHDQAQAVDTRHHHPRTLRMPRLDGGNAFQSIVRTLDRVGDKARGVFGDGRNGMAEHARHAGSAVSKAMSGVERSARQHFGAAKRTTAENFSNIEKSQTDHMTKARAAVVKVNQNLDDSFSVRTKNMLGSVRKNFPLIYQEMTQWLGKINSGSTPTSAPSGPSIPHNKRASGGRIPGVGLRDYVMVAPNTLAAPDELVVNRHTEARIDRMLVGTSLGAEVAGEQRPHSAGLARGGRTRDSHKPRRRLPSSAPPPQDDIMPGLARGGRVGSLASMTRAASAITAHHYSYLWGGGHNSAFSGPYDCSGAVSAVLHAGGLLNAPVTSGALMGMYEPGPGAVTIYANPGHTYMTIDGRAFGTSTANPGGGAAWFSGGARPGFVARHVPLGGRMTAGQRAFLRQLGVETISHKMRARRAGGSGMFHTTAQAAVDRTIHAAQARLDAASGGGTGGGLTSAGGQYDKSSLRNLWVQAGGSAAAANLAAAIALGESGGNPTAHNPSGASGLWQILGVPFAGDPFDPLTNARMAVAKWRAAGGFSPWVVYTTGAYQQYLAKGGRIGGKGGKPRKHGKPPSIVQTKTVTGPFGRRRWIRHRGHKAFEPGRWLHLNTPVAVKGAVSKHALALRERKARVNHHLRRVHTFDLDHSGTIGRARSAHATRLDRLVALGRWGAEHAFPHMHHDRVGLARNADLLDFDTVGRPEVHLGSTPRDFNRDAFFGLIGRGRHKVFGPGVRAHAAMRPGHDAEPSPQTRFMDMVHEAWDYVSARTGGHRLRGSRHYAGMPVVDIARQKGDVVGGTYPFDGRMYTEFAPTLVEEFAWPGKEGRAWRRAALNTALHEFVHARQKGLWRKGGDSRSTLDEKERLAEGGAVEWTRRHLRGFARHYGLKVGQGYDPTETSQYRAWARWVRRRKGANWINHGQFHALGGRLPGEGAYMQPVDWGGWFGKGGSATVRRPTLIGVGDGGDEDVHVIPHSGGAAVAAPRRGRPTISVHIGHIDNHRPGDVAKIIRKELEKLGDELDLVGDDEGEG